MTTLSSLLTIVVPLSSALVIWSMGKSRRSRVQLALTMISCGMTALGALAVLSLIGWEAAFVTIGVACIFGVSLTNATRFWVGYRWDGRARKGRYYALWLLVVGALAGLALTPAFPGGILLLGAFWLLLVYCGYHLMTYDDLDKHIQAYAREQRERHRYD